MNPPGGLKRFSIEKFDRFFFLRRNLVYAARSTRCDDPGLRSVTRAVGFFVHVFQHAVSTIYEKIKSYSALLNAIAGKTLAHVPKEKKISLFRQQLSEYINFPRESKQYLPANKKRSSVILIIIEVDVRARVSINVTVGDLNRFRRAKTYTRPRRLRRAEKFSFFFLCV